jgi:hypothetical protein
VAGGVAGAVGAAAPERGAVSRAAAGGGPDGLGAGEATLGARQQIALHTHPYRRFIGAILALRFCKRQAHVCDHVLHKRWRSSRPWAPSWLLGTSRATVPRFSRRRAKARSQTCRNLLSTRKSAASGA